MNGYVVCKNNFDSANSLRKRTHYYMVNPRCNLEVMSMASLNVNEEKCKAVSEAANRKDKFCQRFAVRTRETECKDCRAERVSKQLVARNADDPRFKEDKFVRAPAVFANNDIKYEVNKLRAQAYAAKTKVGIVYCPAKDTPSAEALRAREDLPSQKLTWLQRHDRESGDLYGMLPLIIGMPVAMTNHINRSIDKRILKGRVGYIHSWIFAEKENSVFENDVRILQKLPRVVFVKF